MSLRRPNVAHLLFTFEISPFCDVAQTSDCGTLVIYFRYKPFTWCRSDVRLWHALSFTFQYKPFMWCRLDARLQHVNLFAHLSRRRFRHPICFQLFCWDFGRTTTWLPFHLTCHANLLYECAFLNCSCASCLHLLYLMSELSCEYIQKLA